MNSQYSKLKNAYGMKKIVEKFTMNDDLLVTKESSELIKKSSEYIPKYEEINKIDLTNFIFKDFYNYFKESYFYVKDNFDIKTNLKCSEITNKNEVPIPSENDLSYIDEFFQNIIYTSLKNSYSCSFVSPFGNGRTINMYFSSSEKQEKIVTYIERMLVWIYIISKYTQNTNCSKILNIYIYLTDPKKILPENEEIIGKNNVNTGFTTSCSINSNIVIYRKEEWFKVFIHETIHNFGLDFSQMDNTNTKNYILNIFPISSKVKLYETYTDFWARTVNCMFCSFYGLVNKNIINDEELFIKNTYKLIDEERKFSYIQVAKILNFMKLDYKDLYTKDFESELKRFLFYKENTSVFAYYILCCVLFNKFNDFIDWCYDNNVEKGKQKILLQFNKTKHNQDEFCKYIESNHNDKSLNVLSEIDDKLKNDKKNGKVKSSEIFYLTLKKSVIAFD